MASLVHNQSSIGDHQHSGDDQERLPDASQSTRPSLRSLQGRSPAARLSPKNSCPLAAEGAESFQGGRSHQSSISSASIITEERVKSRSIFFPESNRSASVRSPQSRHESDSPLPDHQSKTGLILDSRKQGDVLCPGHQRKAGASPKSRAGVDSFSGQDFESPNPIFEGQDDIPSQSEMKESHFDGQQTKSIYLSQQGQADVTFHSASGGSQSCMQQIESQNVDCKIQACVPSHSQIGASYSSEIQTKSLCASHQNVTRMTSHSDLGLQTINSDQRKSPFARHHDRAATTSHSRQSSISPPSASKEFLSEREVVSPQLQSLTWHAPAARTAMSIASPSAVSSLLVSCVPRHMITAADRFLIKTDSNRDGILPCSHKLACGLCSPWCGHTMLSLRLHAMLPLYLHAMSTLYLRAIFLLPLQAMLNFFFLCKLCCFMICTPCRFFNCTHCCLFICAQCYLHLHPPGMEDKDAEQPDCSIFHYSTEGNIH